MIASRHASPPQTPMSTWRKWFEPRRDWQGPNALVPLETCYRIFGLYSSTYCFFGAIAIGFLALTNDSVTLSTPAFWVAVSALSVHALATVFRSLPFVVRYAIFVGSAAIFLICSVAVMGVTPNWSFLVLFLLSSTALLFGVRAGIIAAVALAALHIIVAWGWVSGRLPPIGIGASQAYTDFRSAKVWARVLVISVSMIAAIQLLIRYVLSDMNRALAESKQALQKLSDEQELRARTERRFSAIFNDSPDICGISRLRDGKILDVNRAFETQTGWSRAEAIGRTSLEIGSWENAEDRARVMRMVREKGVVTGHELTWRHRSGALRAGLISIRLMEMDGEQVLNIVIRDITERRFRERALQTFSELTGGITGQEFFAASVRHLAIELGVRFALIVEVTRDANSTATGRTLAAWAGGPAPDFTYTLPGTPCENVVGQGLCHYPDRVAELFPTDTERVPKTGPGGMLVRSVG